MNANHASTQNADAEARGRSVVIVGAGPTGLFMANLLGAQGISVTVVEKEDALIDYPRGVSMDDETLRVLQTVGLVDQALAFTVPNQRIDYVTANGRRLGGYAPTRNDFGWPAKSGFLQPAIDRVLAVGLRRYPNVELLFGREVRRLDEVAGCVVVETVDATGVTEHLEADYVIGCDGGRSATRKRIGASMVGTSESRRWLVMDLRNDPIGKPNVTVFCDPRRPVVSIGLPQGVRRLEIMLFDGEDDVDLDFETARRLAAPYVFDLDAEDIIRKRVYTHHSLVADTFKSGRILIAGDAAHLMPVWQGQGYNTGVRDACNLAWKLALVVQGKADPSILETYDAERRPHATSMVNLSRITGRYLGMTSTRSASMRNAITFAGAAVPPVRDYFMQMKFKPMPRYSSAAVAGDTDGSKSPAGTIFIQPQIQSTPDGPSELLDNVLGAGFAILKWGSDPRATLSDENLAVWDAIGARFITVLPMNQWRGGSQRNSSAESQIVVGDVSGLLRRWFDQNPYPMVFVRPDRIIAAACQPQQADERSSRLIDGLGLTRPATGRDAANPEVLEHSSSASVVGK